MIEDIPRLRILQLRFGLSGTNAEVVDDYAEAMAGGAVFPPVIAFFDGTHYWLADGFHRVASAKKAGLASFVVEIRQGTQRDAKLWAFGANAEHGLRRTNADKRKAVVGMLSDPEWVQWSNREIAGHCLVSSRMVDKFRIELTAHRSQSTTLPTSEANDNGYQSTTLRKGKDGLTINVANIGKKAETPRTRVPMPAFEPGKFYRAWFDDPAGPKPAIYMVEVAPSNHPGYWHFTECYSKLVEGVEDSWVDYTRRPVRLTDPRSVC